MKKIPPSLVELEPSEFSKEFAKRLNAKYVQASPQSSPGGGGHELGQPQARPCPRHGQVAPAVSPSWRPSRRAMLLPVPGGKPGLSRGMRPSVW